MGRMVQRGGLWCEEFRHGWKVKEWSCDATGQRETLVYPRYLYIPQGEPEDDGVAVDQVDQSGTLLEAERLEKAREAARVRGRARAKERCRHVIKAHGLCQLMTGTYKENMTDFDRARRDFAAFLRLAVRYVPGFQAVYAFERQKRGAWHWHAAIHKLPAWVSYRGVPVRSFGLLRALWLRVVGQFEGRPNGTVNFDGHARGMRRGGASELARSVAKVAGYVSKYLTKAVDGLEGRNMWNRTQGLKADRPSVTIISEDLPFWQVIELACLVPEGHRVARHCVDGRAMFWLMFTERSPGGGASEI